MRRLLSLVMILLALALAAQHTTRSGPRRPRVPVASRIAAPVADTIPLPSDSAVILAGYDKTLSSRRESLFITNAIDSATLVWLLVTVDYLDTSGRQLHSRQAHIRCDIPPGETRRLDIPSWDRQCVYYYRLSEPRRRVQAAASPYDVRIAVDSVALRRTP